MFCHRWKKSSTHLLTFYAGLFGLLVSFSACLFEKSQILSDQFSMINPLTWCTYLAIAVSGVLNVWLVNKAISLASPVLISFVRSSVIIIAYSIQILFFHESPSALGIIGSTCVTAAICILPLEQQFIDIVPVYIKHVC